MLLVTNGLQPVRPSFAVLYQPLLAPHPISLYSHVWTPRLSVIVVRCTHCRALIALAGASATIASDALMNPFDGELTAARAMFHNSYHFTYSHQATHAGSPV